MFDIACPVRAILHIAFESDDLLQQLKSFIQVHARAGCDVEDVAGCLRCGGLRGQQVGFYGVVNVGKIAALGTVAEDCRLLACEHLGDELCQHPRVWGSRVLPRSKDIEVTQADRLQPVTAVKRSHVILARQLSDRIGTAQIVRHEIIAKGRYKRNGSKSPTVKRDVVKSTSSRRAKRWEVSS